MRLFIISIAVYVASLRRILAAAIEVPNSAPGLRLRGAYEPVQEVSTAGATGLAAGTELAAAVLKGHLVGLADTFAGGSTIASATSMKVKPTESVPEILEPTLAPVFKAPIEPREPTIEHQTAPTTEPSESVSDKTPTVAPTELVSITPTAAHTLEPTTKPTMKRTMKPTLKPTVKPTMESTLGPAVESTMEPTMEPTMKPTMEPALEPTVKPSVGPTLEPAVESTMEPTMEPTVEPTMELTVKPSVEPTLEPTVESTMDPTMEPTMKPTVEPTSEPTVEPTMAPTAERTIAPSVEPTLELAPEPSLEPTAQPTIMPTANPTELHRTLEPTLELITGPSNDLKDDNDDDEDDDDFTFKVKPSKFPSLAPTVTSKHEAGLDTCHPTAAPTLEPSAPPTVAPSSDDDFPTAAWVDDQEDIGEQDYAVFYGFLFFSLAGLVSVFCYRSCQCPWSGSSTSSSANVRYTPISALEEDEYFSERAVARPASVTRSAGRVIEMSTANAIPPAKTNPKSTSISSLKKSAKSAPESGEGSFPSKTRGTLKKINKPPRPLAKKSEDISDGGRRAT